jgi:hypothetical protein
MHSPVMVNVSPGFTSAIGAAIPEFSPVTELSVLCSTSPAAFSAGGLTAKALPAQAVTKTQINAVLSMVPILPDLVMLQVYTMLGQFR